MTKQKIKKFNEDKNGFTLVETVVAVSIFVAISSIIWAFGRDIFFFNSNLNSSLSVQFDARQILRKVVSELRSTSPSSLGAYPIALAGTSSLTFYSNIDDDPLKEQLRYFLQNGELKRGVIKPVGNPLTYNSINETISTVAKDIVNGNSPIFEYFDRNYAGTSTPLTQPVNALSIRFIRITLVLDTDPNRLPAPFTARTQVNLRNLKDNL